jgi:predicted nucleic acid-binding protein
LTTAEAIIPVYLDTSCAVRLFLDERQEPGCNRQRAKLRELGSVEYFGSCVLRLEFLSALRSRQPAGLLKKESFDLLTSSWAEFSSRRIAFLPISDSVLVSAMHLLSDSKVEGRLRSLDCIHFATFLEVSGKLPGTVLFTTDTVMCALATEASKPFFNPLAPSS